MRAVLVYGYEPSGHASAAFALDVAAKGAGWETRRVNVSTDLHPVLGPVLAKTYLTVIQKCPGLWAALYDNKAVVEMARDWRKLYLLFEGDKLRAKLEELRPDVILCTHAPPLGALALEKRERGLACPLVGVITDYAVHSYWVAPEADLYLVPTPEAAQFLVKQGVWAERVCDTGVPIHPTFAAPLHTAEARRRLGLAADKPVLIVSGGSRGIGSMPEIVQALLGRLPQSQILAVCGSNEDHLKILRDRHKGDQRVKVYGAIEAQVIKELMCASDLLVGKAGGLTIAEATALGLPLVVYEAIPGQEERNADYLVRHGAGVKAESLEELPEVVAGLLPGDLEALRRGARTLGRPDAAERALDVVRRLVPAARLT